MLASLQLTYHPIRFNDMIQISDLCHVFAKHFIYLFSLIFFVLGRLL